MWPGDIVHVSCEHVERRGKRVHRPQSEYLLVVVAELNLLTSGRLVGIGLGLPLPPENGNLKFIFDDADSLFLAVVVCGE